MSNISTTKDIQYYVQILRKANLIESQDPVLCYSLLSRCLQLIMQNLEDFKIEYPSRKNDIPPLENRLKILSNKYTTEVEQYKSAKSEEEDQSFTAFVNESIDRAKQLVSEYKFKNAQNVLSEVAKIAKDLGLTEFLSTIQGQKKLYTQQHSKYKKKLSKLSKLKKKAEKERKKGTYPVLIDLLDDIPRLATEIGQSDVAAEYQKLLEEAQEEQENQSIQLPHMIEEARLVEEDEDELENEENLVKLYGEIAEVARKLEKTALFRQFSEKKASLSKKIEIRDSNQDEKLIFFQNEVKKAITQKKWKSALENCSLTIELAEEMGNEAIKEEYVLKQEEVQKSLEAENSTLANDIEEKIELIQVKRDENDLAAAIALIDDVIGISQQIEDEETYEEYNAIQIELQDEYNQQQTEINHQIDVQVKQVEEALQDHQIHAALDLCKELIAYATKHKNEEIKTRAKNRLQEIEGQFSDEQKIAESQITQLAQMIEDYVTEEKLASAVDSCRKIIGMSKANDKPELVKKYTQRQNDLQAQLDQSHVDFDEWRKKLTGKIQENRDKNKFAEAKTDCDRILAVAAQKDLPEIIQEYETLQSEIESQEKKETKKEKKRISTLKKAVETLKKAVETKEKANKFLAAAKDCAKIIAKSTQLAQKEEAEHYTNLKQDLSNLDKSMKAIETDYEEKNFPGAIAKCDRVMGISSKLNRNDLNEKYKKRKNKLRKEAKKFQKGSMNQLKRLMKKFESQKKKQNRESMSELCDEIIEVATTFGKEETIEKYSTEKKTLLIEIDQERKRKEEEIDSIVDSIGARELVKDYQGALADCDRVILIAQSFEVQSEKIASEYSERKRTIQQRIDDEKVQSEKQLKKLIKRVDSLENNEEFQEGIECCEEIKQFGRILHKKDVIKKFSRRASRLKALLQKKNDLILRLNNRLSRSLSKYQEKVDSKNLDDAIDTCLDVVQIATELKRDDLGGEYQAHHDRMVQEREAMQKQEDEFFQNLIANEAKAEKTGEFETAIIECRRIVDNAVLLGRNSLAKQYRRAAKSLQRNWDRVLREDEGFNEMMLSLTISATARYEAKDFQKVLNDYEDIIQLAQDYSKIDVGEEYSKKKQKLEKSLKAEQKDLNKKLKLHISHEKKAEKALDYLAAINACKEICNVALKIGKRPIVKKYTSLQGKLQRKHQKQIITQQILASDFDKAILSYERRQKGEDLVGALDSCEQILDLAQEMDDVESITKYTEICEDLQNKLEEQPEQVEHLEADQRELLESELEELQSTFDQQETAQNFGDAMKTCDRIKAIAIKTSNSAIKKKYSSKQKQIYRKYRVHLAEQDEANQNLSELSALMDVKQKSGEIEQATELCEQLCDIAQENQREDDLSKYSELKNNLITQFQDSEKQFETASLELTTALKDVEQAGEYQKAVELCEQLKTIASESKKDESYAQYSSDQTRFERKARSESIRQANLETELNIAIAEVEAAEEENAYSEATELCKVIEQLSEKMHNPEIKEKYSSKWNLFESKIKSEQEEKTNLLNSLVVDLEEKEKLQDIGAAKALCEDILKLTSEMDEKVLSKKIKGKLESINRLIKLQSGKKKELEQAMSIVEAKEHQGDYLVAAIMCDQIIILAEDLEKSDLVDQFTSRKEDLERRYSEGYERAVQEIDEKSIEAATKEQSGDYTGALILCEKIKHLAMDIDRPDLAKKFARKIRKLRIQSNKSISEQEALQEDLANLIKLEKSKETERDLLKAVELCVDIIEIASELNDQPQIKKYTTLQDKLLLQHQKQVEKDEKAIAELLLEVEREWKQGNYLAAIDTCDKAISVAKTAKFPSQVKILTKKQSYLQKDHQNYLKQQKKYDKQASKLISSLENFEKEEKYSKAISICSEIITLTSQMNNSDMEKEYMDRKVTLESKVADRKESASEMKKLIQQIDIDARNQNYQAAISACEKVQTQARLLNIPNIADKFTQRKSKLARFLQRQQREQEFLRKDVEEGMATIQMAEASEDLQAIIHECETIQQTALKLQDSDLFEKYEALSVACQEKIASERKAHEETLEAALKQVNLLQAQKDYEGAISACETIVEISPKVDRSELVKTYNRKKAKFVKLSQQSISDEKSLQEELAETVASVKQMEQGEDYHGAIELCDSICEMADELQNTDVVLEYLQRKTDLQEKAIESLRLQNIKLLELINAVEEMEKGKNYGEAIKNCEQIIILAPEVQHPEYIPQYQNKIKRLKRLQKKHFSRRENLKSVLASLQEKIDGKEESKDFQGAIDLCDEAGPIAVEMGDNDIQAQLLSRKETLQEKLKNKHKHTAQIKVLIRKVSQKQKARDFRGAISDCIQLQDIAPLINRADIVKEYALRQAKLERQLKKRQKKAEKLQGELTEAINRVNADIDSHNFVEAIEGCDEIFPLASDLGKLDVVQEFTEKQSRLKQQFNEEEEKIREEVSTLKREIEEKTRTKEFDLAIQACDRGIALGKTTKKQELEKLFTRYRSKLLSRKKQYTAKLNRTSATQEEITAQLQEDLDNTMAAEQKKEEDEDYFAAIDLCENITSIAYEMEKLDIATQYITRQEELQSKCDHNLQELSEELAEQIAFVDENEEDEKYNEAIQQCLRIQEIAPLVNQNKLVKVYSRRMQLLQRKSQKRQKHIDSLKKDLLQLRDAMSTKEKSFEFSEVVSICDEIIRIAIELGDPELKDEITAHKIMIQEKIVGVEEYSHHLNLFRKRVDALQESGKYQDAIGLCEKIIELAPKASKPYLVKRYTLQKEKLQNLTKLRESIDEATKLAAAWEHPKACVLCDVIIDLAQKVKDDQIVSEFEGKRKQWGSMAQKSAEFYKIRMKKGDKALSKLIEKKIGLAKKMDGSRKYVKNLDVCKDIIILAHELNSEEVEGQYQDKYFKLGQEHDLFIKNTELLDKFIKQAEFFWNDNQLVEAIELCDKIFKVAIKIGEIKSAKRYQDKKTKWINFLEESYKFKEEWDKKNQEKVSKRIALAKKRLEKGEKQNNSKLAIKACKELIMIGREEDDSNLQKKYSQKLQELET